MPGVPPRSFASSRLIAGGLAVAMLAGAPLTLAPSSAVAALPEHALMVTEIVPDTVGFDDFEFFEVHNTTASPIDLTEAGIGFSYIYSDSADRTTDLPLAVPAGTVIEAGETVALWLSYTAGSVDSFAKTEAEFRAHFAATQPVDTYRVIRATGQAGFANAGNRGVRVTDPSGELSRSFYPAASASAGRGIDFALPESGVSLAVRTALADPSPGVVAPEALVRPAPEVPVVPVDPPVESVSLAPRDLIITEFLPDNTGTDRYEYFEVLNTTDRAIDLSAAGVEIVYDYLTGTKRLGYPAGATIPARGVAVFWLNYATTVGYGEAEFRAFYGSTAEYTIIPITGQDGFANTAERGIALVTAETQISAARYAAAQIGASLGVDYRLPTRPSATTMSVLRDRSLANPGIVDPESLVPAPFDPKPDPALVTAPLQITEVAPDTANVAGADAYEFIEVYNSTSAPINFRDYSLEYLYPLADLTNSSTALWPATKRDAVIPAGGTLVFWIKNGANNALTADDFNRHFGTSLVADANLLEIYSGGMANSAARGLRVVTNTGHVLNRAYYWLGGVDDTTADMPIQYAVNPTDHSLQTKLGIAAPTPGAVHVEQVEDGLMFVEADSLAPHIVNETATEIPAGADFPLAFSVTDDVQVKTVTLRLRSNLDENFTSTDLIGPAGTFTAQIKAVDLTGKRYFEYELIARDGTHEVTTGVLRLPLSGVDQSPVRLGLAEGSWLRGESTVIAGTDVFPSPAQLTIDGTSVAVTPQLEGAPVFAFEATGVDTFFRNGVKAGDETLRIFDDGIYTGWETIATEIPLSKVTAGSTLTVSVWAGTKAAPEIDLNENNDDFSIRGLRLILPDGRTLAPSGYTDPTQVLAMGDSVGKFDFYEAVFTIPADAATAVQYVWDTAMVADGPHIVAATDGTTTVQRTVSVDNTVPSVTTDLVDGKRYQGEFTIDAAAADSGSGLAQLTATLDGMPIELPLTTSSIKLADGDHTVVFTARDVAGNQVERAIHFTTPVEEPGNELITPADGAQFTDGDAIELRARASDPTDDELSVQFSRAFRLGVGDGVTATTGQTRDADAVVRDETRLLTAEEVTALGRIDAESLSEVSADALPYQIFDVAVPADAGTDARVRVRWDGAANAGAKVRLLVLTTDGTWSEVGRAFAEASAPITLEAAVPVAGHERDGVIRVLVQHSEGFAGADQSTRASEVTPFHAEATPRSAYDFTLAWESDTQYYNEEFHQHQTAIHDFLVAERGNLNLQYLFHTGDIVDDFDQLVQWESASPEYAKLDAAGIPYGVLAGNHDVGHKEIDYTNFGTYFGAERFAENPWWGGDYNDNRGHFDLFSTGGIDFLVLSMGWGPGDAEIAWMNAVLAEYPERVVILNLHEYMLTTGGLGPIPQQIYDEVIATNANVRMVMSGHYHDAYTRIDGFDDDGDGVAERQVYQMLFDYQGLPEGGLGYLRLMHFDNAGGNVIVRTYSPSLLDFTADDPTLEPEHQSFVIPYAAIGVTPQVKTLSTDSFTAEVLTTEPIAAFDAVASGTELAATWQPGVGTHGWFVSSVDPYGARADSEVRLLTVSEAGVEPGGETGGGTGGETGGTGGTGGAGGDSGAGAPATASTPVAVADLDPALQGSISTQRSVRVGDPFTVTIGAAHAGSWVQLWLHSTPTALGGWTQVAANGTVTAVVPVTVAPGAHTLVAQSATGVIGWTTLSVEAAAESAQIASLEHTGAETAWQQLASAVAILAIIAGIGLVFYRRRSEA